MLKHEKLPSTNSIKSGAHSNFAKIPENEHIPVILLVTSGDVNAGL